MARLYTIEPKTEGPGFTMTCPDSSRPLSFVTIEAALQQIQSEEGEAKYKQAEFANRDDGGVSVLLP